MCMRIINYFLKKVLTFLLWIAERFGWRWLKLKVYLFVLYLSVLVSEWQLLQLQLPEWLGPHFYPILYLMVFLLFSYLLYRYYIFFQNPSFYLPWSSRGRRWGFYRICCFLRFFFWFLVMFSFVDWYFSSPDSVLILHFYIGHELMFLLEAFAGLNFVLSCCALCVVVFAKGRAVAPSTPLFLRFIKDLWKQFFGKGKK